jgi:sugar lactone lactonase YvrE
MLKNIFYMRVLDANYYPSTIFCRFPKPAFIENIAGDDHGNLYVTSIDEGKVYRVDSTGSVEGYAKTDGRLTGIVAVDDKTFLCGGWSAEGVPTIYFLDGQQRLIPRLSVTEALFFNGIAALAPGSFLICDAYAGWLWKYDLDSNQATPWLRHELLTRIDPNNAMPAANGIKVYGDTVFVSNTARNTLLAIPLMAGQPGEPVIYLDDINLDDFAIDTDGTIYATTHIFNSVIEIKPGRPASVIADIEHGLAGSTAAMLGRTDSDRRSLYVTTNGGLSLPPAGGLEDGKIVKIELR